MAGESNNTIVGLVTVRACQTDNIPKQRLHFQEIGSALTLGGV
jgi:hypothetical protein